jgi:hypothetical protein
MDLALSQVGEYQRGVTAVTTDLKYVFGLIFFEDFREDMKLFWSQIHHPVSSTELIYGINA